MTARARELAGFLADNPDAIMCALTSVRGSSPRAQGTFMLAMSVVEALSMAVASVADYRVAPRLDTPVTPERVLMGVQRMREARG